MSNLTGAFASDATMPFAELFGKDKKKVSPDDVPVEHLDYDYADGCSDPIYLHAMLEKLRSGKEGLYPQLEEHVEKRMLGLMEPNARKRYLALKHEPTYAEVTDAKDDIAAWLSGVKADDRELRSVATAHGGEGGGGAGAASAAGGVFDDDDEEAGGASGAPASGGGGGGGRTLPPVRGSGSKVYTSSGLPGSEGSAPGALESKEAGGGGSGSGASSGRAATAAATAGTTGSDSGGARPAGWQDPRKGTFKDYYDKWDRFDVDAEVSKVDEAERARRQAIADAEAARAAEAAERRTTRRRQLRDLKLSVDPESMSGAERAFHARREKEKGNEYFKGEEHEDAVLYYGRSLAFADTGADAARVFANRSLANLKLRRYAAAEADADDAIQQDPTFAKAWLRRGSVRHTRGRYLEAIADFERVLSLDPGNKGASKSIREAQDKYREVEGDAAADARGFPKASRKPGAAASGGKGKGGKAASGPVGGSTVGRKIEIEELTDDSEEEEEEAAGGATSGAAAGAEAPARTGFTRLAIAESDSEDEDGETDGESDEEEGHVKNVGGGGDDVESKKTTQEEEAEAAGGRGGRRLAIEESDSDEEEEEEGAAGGAAAASGSAASASAAAPASGGTRLAIAESDSEDDDGGGGGDGGGADGGTADPAAAAAETETAAASSVDPDELRAMGNDLFKAGKHEEAVDVYTDCARVCHARGPASTLPVLIPALSNCALANIKLGRAAAAQANCDAALETWHAHGAGRLGSEAQAALAPVVIKVLFRRGLARRAMGRNDEAAEDFEAVLEAEPDNKRPAEELAAMRAAGWRRAAAAATAAAPAAKAAAPPAAPPASPPQAGAAAAAAAGAGAGASSGDSPASLGVEAAARKRAAEVAAAAKELTLKRAALPPPPGNVSEFERACNSLGDNPAVFCRYLGSFSLKKTAKAWKRPLEADSISAVVRALSAGLDLGGEEGVGPKFVGETLRGLTKAHSFGMSAMMLSKADQATLRDIVGRLRAAGKTTAADDIQAKYKL